MNIIHFTHGKVNPLGESGMSRTVYYLNKHQKMSGHNSLIWSVVDGVKKHEIYKRDEYVTVEMFPRILSFHSLRKGILYHINKNKDKIDLFHIHLMWMYDKNIVANALKKLDIPYVVTTHGAYAKPTSKLKKMAAKLLYELAFLNKASAIHAICYEELYFLRKYGVKSPIFVVPNGIELEEVPENIDNNFFEHKDYISEKIKISWVGNLRSDKNLDGLISAAKLLPKKISNKLIFIIIGPNFRNYRTYLKKLVKNNALEELFYFAGPLYGIEKYNAVRSSDIYIHPSWADVISFAVLDAMACSKPCLISRTSDVSYYYDKKFFVMCEPWPDDIARGLIEVLNRRNEWQEMGHNARKLIEGELNWPMISEKLIENYREVIGEKSSEQLKPSI